MIDRRASKLVLLASLTAALTAACEQSKSGSKDPAPKPNEPATASAAKARVVAVTADDKGFTPSNVDVKKGENVTLRFTRTSDSTCATKVVFPDIKVEKDLPLNKPVDVDVPTKEARKLTFQCGMGMYKSAVLVN